MYIFTLLGELAKLATQELIKWATPYVSQLFNISLIGFTLAFVKSAITYSCVLATVLLSLKILNDLAQTYALGLGDYDHSPTIVMRRAVVSLVAIWAIPQVVIIMTSFASTVNSDVLNLFNSVTSATIEDVFKSVNDNWMFDIGGSSILYNTLMALFIIVMFIIIVFQLVKRCVELIIMAIVGPIFAVSFAGNNQQTSQFWFRHLIALTMGQCLQIFMTRALIYLFITPASQLSNMVGLPIPITVILTLSWGLFTISTPAFLQKFVHAGGTGGGRGGQMAFSAINSGISALKALK